MYTDSLNSCELVLQEGDSSEQIAKMGVRIKLERRMCSTLDGAFAGLNYGHAHVNTNADSNTVRKDIEEKVFNNT